MIECGKCGAPLIGEYYGTRYSRYHKICFREKYPSMDIKMYRMSVKEAEERDMQRMRGRI